MRKMTIPAAGLMILLCASAAVGKTVQASTFGFSEQDATECLRKAILSRADEVVVDNTGRDWIVSGNIQLVSNQTITLADGVVIRAAKGAFQKPRPMFSSHSGRNITIRGRGNARIIMNKQDYRNPKLYTQSEHRHIFSLVSVTGLTIRDLTLSESGGDGIYLGGYAKNKPYSENVLIDNVVFDGSNRLGIAVISGKKVTIRNCRFLNAAGCPPQGGVDFEPNSSAEKMVDCLVENCVFENNKGAALSIAPSKLNASSENVSVMVRNCRFSGNGQGLYFQPYYTADKPYRPVAGSVQIESCAVDDSIQFHTPVESVLHRFKDCTFNTPPRNAPFFMILAETGGETPIGNIVFSNCRLNDRRTSPEQELFQIRYAGQSLFGNKMTGGLAVVRGDQTVGYDFEKLKKEQIKRFAELYSYKPMSLDKKKLNIPPADAVRHSRGRICFRGGCFLQYAQAGQKIRMEINTRRCGYDSSIHVTLKSPSGKIIQKQTVVPGKSSILSFEAKETGIYTVDASTFNVLDINSSHRGNGWVMTRGRFALIEPSGTFYFTVPAGVAEFAVGVSGYGGVLSVRDSRGAAVLQNKKIGALDIHKCRRTSYGKSEVFALECRNAPWDVQLRLYAPLPPVVSTNRATLFR